MCAFPLFLFLLIGIDPSIHPLDVSPCVYAFISPFSLFASWYSSIHSSLGCFHLVCVLFFSPFSFFASWYSSIHPPLDVFTLCAHVYVFVYFFQFRFLFVFIHPWMYFIHPSAPPAAALEDSTTAPPVLLLLLVLSARKRWAKKF
jgi:hypothetical protein